MIRFFLFPFFLVPGVVAVGLLSAPANTAAQEAAANAEGSKMLTPRFFPGKIYTYSSETTVVVSLPGPDGVPADRKVRMVLDARMVTSPRAEGAGIVIDASSERLQFAIHSGEREMKYDSADDSTKSTALGRHFEGSRRRTVTLELDDTPKIVRSEEKGGGGPATPMPGMPQFGPDELKQLVFGLLRGFSPNAVKPGSEWTQKGKRSLGQFGEMDFEINYRYTGDETIEGADCAVIEFGGKLKGEVAVSGGRPGAPGGKLGFEGSGLEGRLVFDKARRAVRESRQIVKMTVDMPNPDPTAGKNLRLPIRQEVTVKLVSIQDSAG